MKKFKVGEVILIESQSPSYQWTHGLYVVLGVKDDTLYMSRLDERGEAEKFDDGRYMSSCTGVNNLGIKRTELSYKLPKGFKHS